MRISIDGVEAAGFFREASGFDSEAEVTEAAAKDSASAARESGGARPSGGLSISGEATDQRHKPWIEIVSHQWSGSVKE